ncbi:MAG: class A beta-lactamase-related serine hydrolase, partial [Candidatus Omnitrophica bacterium]|nr:class A beta-lactamase-related serine hydrolase [Candidatus Omnitrophota bacterium]
LNAQTAALGLSHSEVRRKMMDFSSRSRGIENFTTAEDMAIFLEKLYHGQMLAEEARDTCLESLKNQRINDRIPARLPSGTIVAHKTGLERGVCHDVGIIFAPYADFLVVVLTKGVKTSKPAKEFIASVAAHVYNYWDGS